MNEPAVSKKNQDVFLSNLRQKTGASHVQLEENYYSKAILDSSVTLANYQTYIARLYGVVSACENNIFPSLSLLIPDLDQRFKAPLIVQDLKNTGFADTGNLPTFDFEFSTQAEALGIMYVIEGSTLGGRVLYKNINQSLGLDAQNGASYFWGYGQQTGQYWKTFISLFSQYAVEENCEDEIISSAIQTFDAIDNWLSHAKIVI